MAMKYQFDKIEDIPEAQRPLYTLVEGKYVLDVEGVVPRTKLDEFRDNNIRLQQQIDKFKNVDPTKHQELLDLQRQLQEGELLKKGDVDGLVALRVTNMKTEMQAKIDELSTSNSGMSGQLSVLLIDNVVKTAAINAGVTATAVDDVILRARGIYSVDKGVPVPKGPDGKVIYGSDGEKPLSVADWVVGLKKTAPHLFAQSTGGGAGGGNANPGGRDLASMSALQKISAGLSMRTPREAGLKE